MIDPFSAVLDGVFRADLRALPAAFAAGAATSIGPCVAPRYLALAAIVTPGHRARAAAVFALGVLITYATAACAVGIAADLARNGSVLRAGLGAALAVAAVVTLWHTPHHHVRPLPLSGAFALGSASALVLSPCCAPIVLAVAAVGATGRNPAVAAVLLLAYALGHLSPLLLAGAGLSASPIRMSLPAGTSATVSGAMLLALGAYYGFTA